MIDLQSVTKTYGSAQTEVRALHDVTFGIHTGELVAIVGASGSGKSTLLNVIGGLDPSFRGEISIAGKSIHGMNRRDLAMFRGERFGYVIQSFALVDYWTVEQNVSLPLLYAGVRRRDRRTVITQALERLDVGNKMASLPSELSMGEMQRVAVARAIVRMPSIVLADEPTGSLDATNGAKVVDLLTEYCHDRNATLLIVTHDESMAARMDRTIRLADGEVVRSEPPPTTVVGSV